MSILFNMYYSTNKTQARSLPLTHPSNSVGDSLPRRATETPATRSRPTPEGRGYTIQVVVWFKRDLNNNNEKEESVCVSVGGGLIGSTQFDMHNQHRI